MSENLITVVGTGKKAKKERLKLIREALAETFSLPNPPSTADGNSTVVVPEGRNSRKRHRRRLQQHAAEHFATTTPLAKPRVISARNTMNVNVNNFNNLFSGPVNARVVPDNELSPRHTDKTRFSTGGADLDIVLSNPMPKTYTNCGIGNVNLASDNGDFWHMIIINHGQKFTKAEILQEIFNIVAPSDFYPVCYTQSKTEDYFLVRQSRSALIKLFQKNLRLKFKNDQLVYMTVKLDIAHFKLGHIYPAKVFQKAMTNRFNALVTWEGAANVLNLDAFASGPEFISVEVDLNNAAAFQLFCTTLDNKLASGDASAAHINGIRLSNNNLQSISAFDVTNLQKIRLQLLDLRHNEIEQIENLRSLKKYMFSDLYVSGNPVSRVSNYANELRQMLPFIMKIDDAFSKVAPAPKISTGSKTIPIQYVGDIYDSTDQDFQERVFRKHKTSTRWHQVIIHHEGKINQTEILDAIFEIVAMNDFYPCYYQCGDLSDMFFVRESYESLELLYVKRLQLPNRPDIARITLKMNVADFKDGQVQPTTAIAEQINKRFNLMDRTLDLSNFSSSSGFEDFICRLSNPRTFSVVVSQASRRFLSNVDVLKLNDNGIRSARGTHSLVWMKSLREIDLSNNNIADVAALESIPKGSYTDIWLKGNPLCLKFARAKDYFEAIRKVIPSMEKLDGKESSQFDTLNGKQNFICKVEGHEFVEQFVEHYFNSYDSFNRYSFIKGLYHPTAVVSISCHFQGMGENQIRNFKPYVDRCRNILRNPHIDPLTNVFYGQENVAGFWSSFKQTKHDMKSFTIDLTSYTSMFAIITVNGIFKEMNDANENQDNILGFSRTFVLKKFASGLGLFGCSAEYRIINEIALFYRPSAKQLTHSFSIVSEPKQTKLEPPSAEDKQCLMIVFNDLTGLNQGWCRKILEKSAWNVREALESFVELASNSQFSEKAFVFNQMIQ